MQEKYREIEQEIKLLKEKGELEYDDFKEEFKDLKEVDGDPIIDRDEQLEEPRRNINKSLLAYGEPDDKEKSPTGEGDKEPKSVVRKQRLKR